MNLHVEKIGSGDPLVLLHGWGMHGGVWAEVAQKLAVNFCVHSVDLPGYGFSVGRDSSRLDEDVGINPDLQLRLIVERISAQFDEPVAVCGWSLGGQIALRWAASKPEQVQKLILVASTPCFTQREDWQWGMAAEVLQKFAEELEQNHATTLRRFISLQLRGSENERELLALLRERLFARGEPDMNALRAGLNILRDVDLRSELSQINMPVLIIAGERDKLTPPEASHHMAQVMANAQLEEVKGAAHAPFLSHPEIFIEQVSNFLHERI
ncbi:MAG: pimeloyl-ACP methyl ester esterase BioH [Gallionellaceae bacterium]|nr:pimeloyl-ACP methyl ester esterase BioH [Gallionellaceae bacterium]